MLRAEFSPAPKTILRCGSRVWTGHAFRLVLFLQYRFSWTAIQRRGSILAWTVFLSVYGADTIAIVLSLFELIS